MIIQEYVKEKFPLAYDYFESCGWKYCPISYKNLWGWKKQLEKGSLGTVILLPGTELFEKIDIQNSNAI